MGSKDLALRAYLTDNRVFADIINMKYAEKGFTVTPDMLRDMDSAQIISIPSSEETEDKSLLRERRHDIVKALIIKEYGEQVCVMLSIEGQTKSAPFMPLRNLQYDDHSMTYAAERLAAKRPRNKGNNEKIDFLTGFSENDRIPPAVTIVFYLGKKKWRGKSSLHDMLLPHPAAFTADVPNVPLNMVSIYDFVKQDVDSFYSDIGVVATFVAYEHNSAEFIRIANSSQKFKSISPQAAELIRQYTGLDFDYPEKQETVNMYYAIQQLMEENGKQREEKAKREGIIEGKREGIIEGKREGIIEGKREGIIEGKREGIIEGKREGIIEGKKEGIIEGKKEERQNNINILISINRKQGHSQKYIAKLLEEFYSIPYDEAMRLASQ